MYKDFILRVIGTYMYHKNRAVILRIELILKLCINILISHI